MLKTAELLHSKLLEHDSKVLALKYVSEQIPEAMKHGLDRSLGPDGLEAVQHGRSMGKALISDAGADSPYGNGPLHTRGTSPSARQLLGILGIISDNDLRKVTPNRRLKITAVDQERKLDITSNEAEELILSTIATSTKDFSDAQQLLLNALLIDTMYADVKMSKSDLQTRKEGLHSAIENIGAGLAFLDLGKVRAHGKTRKDFVGRWNAG